MAVETEVQPRALEEPEPGYGQAAAVTLATGVGAFVLGVVTTLSEASTRIADALQWNDRVGPLSGKSIIGAGAFFVSWGALAALWRRSSPQLRPVIIATVVLLALALLGTFPTFFQAFSSE